MAGILGGASKASTKPDYTGLQLQTSANGLPVPIVYGQTKLAPNLIWYGDFAAIKHTQDQGGKGGDTSSATYTYQTAAMLALCEGPIQGIATVWADKTVSTLSALNMSLYSGTAPQPVWGYIQSHHPDQALAYPSTAYIAVAPYDLGSSAGLPNHNFEVQGVFYGSGGVSGANADPSSMVLDFLSNPQYGVGFPAANIDMVSLQTGQASYRSYCQATGLSLSAALVDQEAARDTLTRWLQLTNTAAFWSGDTLKLVPYGDTAVVANGFQFIPDVTPAYDLNDDDYLAQDDVDPIQVTRKDPADCKNWVKLEILDRSNAYATDPIEAKDQAQIDLYGPLPADQITAHEICDPSIGAIAAQLILQRSVYIRNTYAFSLGWEYCLLEPMDIVTLTDVRLGMNKTAVRITSVEEDDQGNLSIEAEEFPAGIASAAEYPKQTRTAYSTNYDIPSGPVNDPVIFEPSADLAGRPQVWVAVSGGANWGGCSVHLSIDGATYTRIGQIQMPARVGTLSAAIEAVADPDSSSTLHVDLTESPGATLAGGSQADADASRTLIYVDGELMAYETAGLAGIGRYVLTYLRRGLYGTAIAAHPVGGQFARLDGTLFEYDLPQAYIGQPLYLKFTSFNIYGAAEEDISAVSAYEYVPNGKGSFIAPPSDVVLSSTARTASDGNHILTLVESWLPSPGPLLDHYEAQYKLSSDADWTGANPGQATAIQIAPAIENATYQGRVRAVSTLGYHSEWVTAADTASGALTTTVPVGPSGLTATGAGTVIRLRWLANPEPDVQGYRLRAVKGVDTNFGDATVVYQGDTLGYDYAGLDYETPYEFWLEAYNVAGYSAPAGPAFAVTGAYDGSIPPNSITDDMLVASLSQTIADTKGVITDQINTIADAVSDAHLSISDLRQSLGDVFAQAKQDLTSYTDGATEAEAAERLTLEAVVDQNAATALQNFTVNSDAISAQATALTALQATVGDNISAVTDQISGLADALSATASDVTTLSATVGDNYATLTEQLTAATDTSSANATAITTLQSSFGGLDASVQTLQSTVAGPNGLSSQYTVKVDTNGHVAGFGLASVSKNGVVTSSFVIRADSFQVVNPVANGQVITPFRIVNGSVFMNDAYIQNISAAKLTSGQIRSAFIQIFANGSSTSGLEVYNSAGTLLFGVGGFGDNVVGTSVLQLGAASAPHAAYTAAMVDAPRDGAWHAIQTVSVSIPSGASGVLISYSLYAASSAGPPSGGGGGGGNGGGSCFLAGAIVTMADGSSRPIERVRVGEFVMGRHGEANEVLGWDRPLLGDRKLYLINGGHTTTNEHPHWTDTGPACINPDALYADDWGREWDVILGDGSIDRRVNIGLTRPVRALQLGDRLGYRNRHRRLRSILIYRLPAETQLFNLVLGGSHTYRVDGYHVTGWPREDDFDYDNWRAR